MKHFLSFCAGLILILLLTAIGFWVIFISSFTLSSQTLSEKENIDALFFYSTIAGIVIAAVIAYWGYRSQKKYFSIGIFVGSTPLLIGVYINAMVYFKNIFYYQAFDKQKWKTSDSKPFNMAKTLANKKMLIGLSKKEVINKLGYFKDSTGTNGQTLIYYTEQGWDFCIDLTKDTVTKVYLYEPGFGID